MRNADSKIEHRNLRRIVNPKRDPTSSLKNNMTAIIRRNMRPVKRQIWQLKCPDSDTVQKCQDEGNLQLRTAYKDFQEDSLEEVDETFVDQDEATVAAIRQEIIVGFNTTWDLLETAITKWKLPEVHEDNKNKKKTAKGTFHDTSTDFEKR